jgi:hypothetical protein
MFPRVGSVEAGRKPVGPIEPATKRCSPAARRLAVDLQRLLAQTPLFELQSRALEGVGLEDLGAGLQHRLMNTLDHVGPIQHQHLVTLAGQPAIVLSGQLKLLQRRAHAAVEDDNALLRSSYVVALRHEPKEATGA